MIMCLLLDHGLRVSEVDQLKIKDFNLQAGLFSFYRPKVDQTQTHKMTRDTLWATADYFQHNVGATDQLIKGANRNGELTRTMSIRAITKRVQILGEDIDIDDLSPHDCRHYAATKYARTKNLRELMDIFGWTSPAMAARYIQSAEIVDPE